MLAIGDRIPEATVWLETRDRVSLRELTAKEAALLLFYLFDWSST
jgi:peroxiredoxin